MPEPRKSSSVEYGEFPYGGATGLVCYMTLGPGGDLQQIRGAAEMRAAIKAASLPHSLTAIYAVWPGQYRSDLFIIDDVPALARANGIKES